MSAGVLSPGRLSGCLSACLWAADMRSWCWQWSPWERKGREKKGIKGGEAWQLVGLLPEQLELLSGAGGGGVTEDILAAYGHAGKDDRDNQIGWKLRRVMLGCFNLYWKHVMIRERVSVSAVRIGSLFVFPPADRLGGGAQVCPRRRGWLLSVFPCDWLEGALVTVCLDSKIWPFLLERGREKAVKVVQGQLGV